MNPTTKMRQGNISFRWCPLQFIHVFLSLRHRFCYHAPCLVVPYPLLKEPAFAVLYNGRYVMWTYHRFVSATAKVADVTREVQRFPFAPWIETSCGQPWRKILPWNHRFPIALAVSLKVMNTTTALVHPDDSFVERAPHRWQLRVIKTKVVYGSQ